MSRVGIFFIIATFTVSNSVDAGEWVEGRLAHIRDGDTIEVNNLPIRLVGVDGSELNERSGKGAKRWINNQCCANLFAVDSLVQRGGSNGPGSATSTTETLES